MDDCKDINMLLHGRNGDCSTFSIGGINIGAKIPEHIKNLIYKKIDELIASKKQIHFLDSNPKIHDISTSDIFVIHTNDPKIGIVIPNYINTKQTHKAYGIIVCKQVEQLSLNLQHLTWESQIFVP